MSTRGRTTQTRLGFALFALFFLFSFFSSFSVARSLVGQNLSPTVQTCLMTSSHLLAATASAVFPQPIEKVWALLRDFEAVPKVFEGVESVTLDGSPHAVGSTRTIKWKSGEELSQKLLELSDLHFTVSWENALANFPTDSSAQITTVQLHRITETKGTFVRWSAEFAADVAAKTVTIEETNFLKNLADIRASLK